MKDWSRLGWTLGILTFIWIIWSIVIVVELLHVDVELRLSGTVPVANTSDLLTTCGFGPTRRLVIIDLSKLGGVEGMHDDDKRSATWEFYERGQLKQKHPIGIEFKGRAVGQRAKYNYGFETQKCDGNLTVNESHCSGEWEGIDADLGLGLNWPEYEDYVLRGSESDQTFVRDTLTAQIGPVQYETILVELVFKNDDVFTYEGVYIVLPNVKKKDVYRENTGNLSPDGKWIPKGKLAKCGEDVYSNGTVESQIESYEQISGIVYEYSAHGPPRDEYCSITTEHFVEMSYPKCSKIVEDDPCFESRSAWIRKYTSLVLAQSLTDALNLQAFAHAMVSELVLMRYDFGRSSVYLYVAPNTSSLSPGSLYDSDSLTWKIRNVENIDFDLEVDPMPLYKTFLSSLDGVDIIKQVHAAQLDLIQHAAQSLYETRLEEEALGYFSREVERWPTAGTRYHPAWIAHEQYLYPEAISKNTLQAELLFGKSRILRRVEYLRMKIPELVEPIRVHVTPIAALIVRKNGLYITYSAFFVLFVVFFALKKAWPRSKEKKYHQVAKNDNTYGGVSLFI